MFFLFDTGCNDSLILLNKSIKNLLLLLAPELLERLPEVPRRRPYLVVMLPSDVETFPVKPQGLDASAEDQEDVGEDSEKDERAEVPTEVVAH